MSHRVTVNGNDVSAGYGKTITHVIIGLKTAKGTKQLKLDPSIYESLQKEKVEPGDVIYIEANSGAVKVTSLFLFTQNNALLTFVNFQYIVPVINFQ